MEEANGRTIHARGDYRVFDGENGFGREVNWNENAFDLALKKAACGICHLLSPKSGERANFCAFLEYASV